MMRLCLSTIVLAPCLTVGAWAQSGNCEVLRAQVESRIASAGVSRFTVSVADAASSAPGRVVGTCDKGASKLLYVQQGGGGRVARPPSRGDQPVLTECKDGTVTLSEARGCGAALAPSADADRAAR